MTFGQSFRAGGDRERIPPMTRGEVHVWQISASAETNFAELAKTLSPEETNRASQFYWERDRRMYMKCRSALRHLIGLYTGQNAASIRFRLGPQGKPSLSDPSAEQLHFNASHSRDLALLAFTLDSEIGIDVEFMRGDIDFLDLAKTVFSAHEQAALLSCPATVRAKLFYELWTRKEACIKADGRGLSIPLEQFSVSHSDPTSSWREVVSHGAGILSSGMRSRVLDIGGGYAAAIAGDTPSFMVSRMDWPIGARRCCSEMPRSKSECVASVRNLQAAAPQVDAKLQCGIGPHDAV